MISPARDGLGRWWVTERGRVLSGPYTKQDTAYDAARWHRKHPGVDGYPPVLGGQGRDCEMVVGTTTVLLIIGCAGMCLLALLWWLS